MKLRRTISFASLLFCAALAPAQNVKPKQEAKELSEKAKTEDGDKIKQARDACQAAQLDAKNKKYQEDCDGYRAKIVQDDTGKLTSATEAYQAHDLEKAEAQAKLVSTFDDKLAGQAKVLIEKIANDRLFNQLKAAWNKGDFQSVNSIAQSIASPELKASAKLYLDDINLYNQYIEQGQKLEKDRPQEAIKQYVQAKQLNPNGPNDPAGKILEVEKRFKEQYSLPSTTATTPVKTTPDSTADTAKKVGKLMNDARTAEKAGKMQDALTAYGSVLKMQPHNQDAQTSSDRVQAALKNDPAAAAKDQLTSAIRYFYHSQFDDAQRVLKDYLNSPQAATNQGPAYFYLGATLVEQAMLETPSANWQGPSADAQAAFKEARKANYNPVRDYVSPALLKVWDATSQ
jgi:hypothetical protein